MFWHVEDYSTLYDCIIIRFTDLPAEVRRTREKLEIILQSLDHLITLHQQKCDELRDVKKYMLQNMFI